MTRRRPWPAVAAMLALVGSAACGGEPSADGCLEELLPHVPGDAGIPLEGTGLARARAEGFDDSGDPPDVFVAAAALGISLDPVTRGRVLAQSSDEAAAPPGAVECWLGHGRGFAAIGAFDAAAATTDAVTDGRLLVLDTEGDPAVAFEGRTPDPRMTELLREVADAEMVSFLTFSWADEPVSALGVASIGDEPRVAVRWVYGSERAADEAMPEIAQLLGDSTFFPLVVGDIDPTSLSRDGATLAFSMPLLPEAEPLAWRGPAHRLDPALVHGLRD